jgi:hypothetical protein
LTWPGHEGLWMSRRRMSGSHGEKPWYR